MRAPARPQGDPRPPPVVTLAAAASTGSSERATWPRRLRARGSRVTGRRCARRIQSAKPLQGSRGRSNRGDGQFPRVESKVDVVQSIQARQCQCAADKKASVAAICNAISTWAAVRFRGPATVLPAPSTGTIRRMRSHGGAIAQNADAAAGGRDRKGEHSPVERRLVEPGNVQRAERGQRSHDQPGQRQAGQRSPHREDRRFSDQLPQQSPPCRTDRFANGRFLFARRGLREKKIGHVEAGDEQHHRDRAEQHRQSRPVKTCHHLEERLQDDLRPTVGTSSRCAQHRRLSGCGRDVSALEPRDPCERPHTEAGEIGRVDRVGRPVVRIVRYLKLAGITPTTA